MEIMVYYENNGSLCALNHGNDVSLVTAGGQYPIEKLVAQYSVGTFTIANEYLKYGIDTSIRYAKNYDELANSGYGLENVLSAYNFTISPKYGQSRLIACSTISVTNFRHSNILLQQHNNFLECWKHVYQCSW